jgi:hypothetical protein
MVQTIALIAGAAGVVLICFLVFGGGEERSAWLTHTLIRARRESARARAQQLAAADSDSERERIRIEAAWEEQLGRARLQEAERGEPPLRRH